MVTEMELRLVSGRPAWFAAFVPVADDDRAIALVSDFRAASKETWEPSDADGSDVAAIEYLDRRCLELLREDRVFARTGFPWPADAGAALIFQAELPAVRRATTHLTSSAVSMTPTLILRFCVSAALLVDHGVFEVTTPMLPGETARKGDALFRLRESAPEGGEQAHSRAPTRRRSSYLQVRR